MRNWQVIKRMVISDMADFSGLSPVQMAKLAEVAPNLVPKGATVASSADKVAGATNYTWGGTSTPPPAVVPQQQFDMDAMMANLMKMLQPILDGQTKQWDNFLANQNQINQTNTNQANYNAANQSALSLQGGNTGGLLNNGVKHESGASIGINQDGKSNSISRYLSKNPITDMWKDKGGV